VRADPGFLATVFPGCPCDVFLSASPHFFSGTSAFVSFRCSPRASFPDCSRFLQPPPARFLRECLLPVPLFLSFLLRLLLPDLDTRAVQSRTPFLASRASFPSNFETEANENNSKRQRPSHRPMMADAGLVVLLLLAQAQCSAMLRQTLEKSRVTGGIRDTKRIFLSRLGVLPVRCRGSACGIAVGGGGLSSDSSKGEGSRDQR
jgi:hypothetical protein